MLWLGLSPQEQDGVGGCRGRELQALFGSLGLGFAPADVAKLFHHCAGVCTDPSCLLDSAS